MPCRHDHQHLFMLDDLIIDVRAFDGQVEKGQIGFAIQEHPLQLAGVLLHHVQTDIGVHLIEHRQGAGQHIRAPHGGERDFQGTMVVLDNIVHFLIQFFFQVQDFRSLCHIPLPGVGQHEFMPQLTEQLLPHLVFKRL